MGKKRQRNEDDEYVEDLPRYDNQYHPQWAFKLALAKNTNAEIGAVFGVKERCFEEWMQRYPRLKERVHAGREMADAEVAHAVYRSAKGYEHPAVKINQYEGRPVVTHYTERYPPNIQAATLFLTNRDARWKNKVTNEQSGPDGDPIEVAVIERVVIDPKAKS